MIQFAEERSLPPGDACNHDLTELRAVNDLAREAYLVEAGVLEPVEAGEPAGGRAVPAAPQSDAVALHHVVRTLASAGR